MTFSQDECSCSTGKALTKIDHPDPSHPKAMSIVCEGTHQAFLPLSPPLNPNARAFVPGSSPSLRSAQEHLCRSQEIAELTMLDGVGVETSPEDVAAIEQLRKSLPKGQKIKYSIKEMMGMKPLNPNAAEFVPLWLQGIHTERDFAVSFQAKVQTAPRDFKQCTIATRFERSSLLPQKTS